MTKTRILIISVIVLAVINIATLSFMLLKKSHHKRGLHKQQTCQNDKNPKQCNAHQQGDKCHKEYKQGCKEQKCKKGTHKGPKGDGKHNKAMISQKLGFDEDQKTKFDAITDAHFAEIKTQHEEKRTLKKKLFDLLKNDEVSTDKKDDLIAQNLVLEKKILNTKIAHFQSIKEICKPEQVDGFLEIVEHMGNKKKKK